MHKPRLLYLSRHFDSPAGGVRVAHRHVEMLCKNGFDAAILLLSDDPARFFQTAAPLHHLGASFSYGPTDVFVIPELWNDCLALFRPTVARKVVFCQNHLFTPAGLKDTDGYGDFGVSAVFCCGDVIARYLTDVLGIARAPVVHNGIDHSLFRPRAKRLQIAYMPRKMPSEAAFIRQTLRRRHPRFAAVPWVAIDRMPESEAAAILGESAVFLSLARLEGFGLPPLEAMAAGALVAGFHGDGGREYAAVGNGAWCAAEDWIACVDAVNTVLTRLADHPDAAAQQQAEGFATADEYSLERMERELVAFWNAELAC